MSDKNFRVIVPLSSFDDTKLGSTKTLNWMIKNFGFSFTGSNNDLI